MLKKSLISLALVSMFSSAAFADAYKLIDLGTLGGSRSFAFSINDNNVVVGSSSGAVDSNNSTVFSNHAYVATLNIPAGTASLQDIGHLGGNDSTAFFIDSNNLVYGQSLDSLLGSTRSFVFDGVQIIDLGLPIGATKLGVMGKDDTGLMIGYSNVDVDSDASNTVSDYRLRAIVRDTNGAYTFLDMLKEDDEQIIKGSSVARAINSARQIVGYGSSKSSSRYLHAVRWDFATSNAAIDLGTLGGHSAQANDINEQGLIVGLSQTTGDKEVQPFIYDPSLTTPMFGLGQLRNSMVHGEAYAINNNNEVVGTSVYVGGMRQRSHATYYKYDPSANAGATDNTLLDLNKYISCADQLTAEGQQKWELNEARDINNNGVIIGHGTVEGEIHAFALVPPAGELTVQKCTVPKDDKDSGGSLPWGLVALLPILAIIRRRR